MKTCLKRVSSGVREYVRDTQLCHIIYPAVLAFMLKLKPDRYRNMCHIERSGWLGQNETSGEDGRWTRRQSSKRGAIRSEARLQKSWNLSPAMSADRNTTFLCLSRTCNISTSISRGCQVREYKLYTCQDYACPLACDAISCRDRRLHRRDYRIAIYTSMQDRRRVARGTSRDG
jgi:hypothetical protein